MSELNKHGRNGGTPGGGDRPAGDMPNSGDRSDGRDGSRDGAAGMTCPECGAAAGPDGALSCACEVEGFGPLRVRPYVTLPEPSRPAPPRAPDPYAHPPLPPEQRPPADEPDPDPAAEPSGGRGGSVLLMAAVAGIISVAALVAVLISAGDEGAPASAHESSVAATAATTDGPTPSAAAGSASASADRSAAPSETSASPSASATTRVAPSTSPTGSPSPTATASATPSPSRTSPSNRPEISGPVLRRGDRGPDVTELQSRLGQLHLYMGSPTGRFDGMTEYAVRTYQLARGIDADTPGTYGPATRRALETETAQRRMR